mgnify:FL=1
MCIRDSDHPATGSHGSFHIFGYPIGIAILQRKGKYDVRIFHSNRCFITSPKITKKAGLLKPSLSHFIFTYLEQDRCRDRPSTILSGTVGEVHLLNAIVISQSQTIIETHLQVADQLHAGTEVKACAEILRLHLIRYGTRDIPKFITAYTETDIRTGCQIRFDDR